MKKLTTNTINTFEANAIRKINREIFSYPIVAVKNDALPKI